MRNPTVKRQTGRWLRDRNGLLDLLRFGAALCAGPVSFSVPRSPEGNYLEFSYGAAGDAVSLGISRRQSVFHDLGLS
jgi:hypothetical protein